MSQQDAWVRVLNERIQSFEGLSDWAAITQLGKVRDYCRLAIAELRHEIARWEIISLDEGKSNVPGESKIF